MQWAIRKKLVKVLEIIVSSLLKKKLTLLEMFNRFMNYKQTEEG